MARDQTIFSELAVALALSEGSLEDIINVTPSAKEQYLKEYEKRSLTKAGQTQIANLEYVGKSIRKHLLCDGVHALRIEWTGNEKTSAMSAVAKDIYIQNLNLRLSIKESADVFINASPDKIFEHMPFGEFAHSSRGVDWFLSVASKEFNDYFLACGGLEHTGFSHVEDFYHQTKRKERDVFSDHVTLLHKKKEKPVLNAYKHLCQKVSAESSRIFNENLTHYLQKNKNKSNALQPIFHYFFRINGVRYILAGTDKKKPFALYMNPTDVWNKSYEFMGIHAMPLDKGQPEVLLLFSFKNKHTLETFTLDLKVEIRWSHGKFCGNPEGKIYKKWQYATLPWSENIPLICDKK